MVTETPAFDSVDNYTSDLLDLVATDNLGLQVTSEWDTFIAAVRGVAAGNDGVVTANALRPLIRDKVAPRRIGAYYHRACTEDLIRATGGWEISDDTQGRNAGRPTRIYAITPKGTQP